MAATKGRVIAEYAVTVTHNDRHVLVSWDGKVQYRALQDGWTSEASAIREAAVFALDTAPELVQIKPNPYTHGVGAGHYTMTIREKG